jgi:capsular polysaccharide export protein
MKHTANTIAAGEDALPRRLFVYNGGFLTQGRIRRILKLAGWDIRLGAPSQPDARPGAGKEAVQDWIGIWGKSPTAHRGESVARKRDAPVLRVEDAFLRSVHTGRDGDAPLGLLLDQRGVHFDSSCASDLEHILATHPLDDTALLDRARYAADHMRLSHLSKYNAYDLQAPCPDAPYVLVIDQTRGDASIRFGGADEMRFREMLVVAQLEHPGAKILIKTHPETVAGHRKGHFTAADETDRIQLIRDPLSPWALLEGAIAVYTVSSQLGFEAIYAGHRPRVFGQPFYASWGLSQDEYPVARRVRKLTRAQLFAGAMILYPTWYDPCRDQLCELETVMAQLETDAATWRQDQHGYVASGMRLWKRPALQGFFGQSKRLRFENNAPQANRLAQRLARPHMGWAGNSNGADTSIFVEDGFLRSRGLGAALTPPLSLVADDLGIYYDPTRPSRLEQLITARSPLPAHARVRVERLISGLIRAGISKYNLGRPGPVLPEGHRILVPGQVEDDASILKGCADVASNLGLLQATRAANPQAIILFKPHPDVEAGLRAGTVDRREALQHADAVIEDADPVALIDLCDEIWTLTSLLGFEALLRGKPVTCLGAPFYAGWGLTQDLGKTPERRAARPTLAALVHATLIDYPRYFDPVSRRLCPVEVVVQRLEHGDTGGGNLVNRLLSKTQGALTSYSWIWR